MKYLFLLATVILALAACLAGCSSKSNNEAENEGIEEVSDGDLEENLDEPEEAEPEEIAEEEAEDEEISNEILDEELIEYEEEINEEEKDNFDVEKLEEDVLPDGDDSTEELVEEEFQETPDSTETDDDFETARLTVRQFPWEGVKVTSCEGVDPQASFFYYNVIWDDGLGNTYIGGRNFWKFSDGTSPEVKCDPRVPEVIFSMTGRNNNNETEVWIGMNGKIAKYVGDAWTIINFPSDMMTQDSDKSKNNVVDLDFAEGVLAVLTNEKLGFFNTVTKLWRVETNCPANLNKTFGLHWDGTALWACAGLSLYTVDAEAGGCLLQGTLQTESSGTKELGILNPDDSGLWLALSDDGILQSVYTYIAGSFNLVNLPALPQSDGVAIGQGMGGWPLLYWDTFFIDQALLQECSIMGYLACSATDFLVLLRQNGTSEKTNKKVDTITRCKVGTQYCDISSALIRKTLLTTRRMLKGGKHLWLYSNINPGIPMYLSIGEVIVRECKTSHLNLQF